MSLSQVFHRVFKAGCGESYEKVRRSLALRMAADELRSIRRGFDTDSDEAVALTCGVRSMSLLLAHHTEREALRLAAKQRPASRPNVKMQATIEMLGDRLIDAACDSLTPEMRKLAEQWRGASASRQIELGTRLYSLLRRTPNVRPDRRKFPAKPFWLRDVLDQSLDRTLPRRFGVFGTGGNPNCLGKAQLVLAFARLAGARALGMILVTPYWNLIGRSYERLAGRLLGDFGEGSNPLTAHGRKMIESILESERESASRPDYFHMAVVLELADGRRMMLDPHGAARGILGPEWRAEEADRLLSKYRSVLPGLTIHANDGGAFERRLAGMERTSRMIAWHAKNLERHLERADAPGTNALRYLALTQVPDIADAYTVGPFVKLLGPYASRLKIPRTPIDYEAHLLGGTRFASNDELGRFLQAHQQTAWWERRLQGTAAAVRRLHEFVSGDPFAGFFVGPARMKPDAVERIGREFLPGLLSLFPWCALRHLDGEVAALERRGAQIHPEGQFCNAPFQLGVQVLSHVGIDLGAENLTERFLGHYSSDQYRLLHVALEPVRTRRRKASRTCREAAEVLSSMPSQLRTARRGLAMLVSKGFLRRGTIDGRRHTEPRPARPRSGQPGSDPAGRSAGAAAR